MRTIYIYIYIYIFIYQFDSWRSSLNETQQHKQTSTFRVEGWKPAYSTKTRSAFKNHNIHMLSLSAWWVVGSWVRVQTRPRAGIWWRVDGGGMEGRGTWKIIFLSLLWASRSNLVESNKSKCFRPCWLHWVVMEAHSRWWKQVFNVKSCSSV